MKQYLIQAGVAVAVVVLAFLFVKPVQNVVNNVGSSTGPDSFFSCENHNGVTRCFNRIGLAQATTTVCSIKSPGSTSTLVSGGIRISNSTTSNSTITFGKAVNYTATTTSLGQVTFAAGTQVTAVASSTWTQTNDFGNGIFAPNTFFNVGIQGGVGPYVLQGTCQATFESF